MNGYRREHDLLGECSVPAGALHGIHTERALANFPLAGRPVRSELIRAYGAVKLAAARANFELGFLQRERFDALSAACRDMLDGELDEHVVVDALQGGAGTSTNMNVNEVLANRALQRLGLPLGNYSIISPHDDVNRHQSTNDTFPSALKVAAIGGLRGLERSLIGLFEAFQAKEREFADVVKIGRTQLQDAVLMTMGREMASYAEALSRDRWRVYKCEERLRVLNLGGTAIGTSIGAPRRYIFRVVEHLKEITGFGFARAENLVEATQNADVFVEVSGILRTMASNLYKIATDLRLLGSGPNAGIGELKLPPRQAGSSIMPGKVNPVIPEAVSQAAIAVMGHDQMITQAASAGNLELSQFMPLIAESLITTIDLLDSACDLFARLCVSGLEVDRQRCTFHQQNSTSAVTALVDRIGYSAAETVAQAAVSEGKTVRELVIERGLLTAEEFDQEISPEAVNRLGSPIAGSASPPTLKPPPSAHPGGSRPSGE